MTQTELLESMWRLMFNRRPMRLMASFDFIGIGLLLLRFRDGPCESVRMQSEKTDTMLGPGSAEYSILSRARQNSARSSAGTVLNREQGARSALRGL